MDTILSGNDTANRLLGVLGSAALLSDTSDAMPALPGSLLSAIDSTSDQPDASQSGTDTAAAAGAVDVSLDGGPAASSSDPAISPVTSLLGAAGTEGLGGVLDVAHVTDSVSGILDLGNITGGTADGMVTNALPLAGNDGLLQPEFDVTNTLITDFHHDLSAVGLELGAPQIVNSVINLGETIGLGDIGVDQSIGGQTNLVTDVLNLPGQVLGGQLDDGLHNISYDLSNTVDALDHVINAVTSGSDPLNPLPELVGGVTGSILNSPLLTLNGGNGSADGGLVGGIVGDLTHSSSGHLIDVDAGPAQDNGLTLDALSAPDGNGHSASVNAVDVGPNGPQLLDLGLLNDVGGLNLADAGGADGLVGQIAGGVAGDQGPTGTALPVIGTVESHDLVADLVGADHGILDLHGSHII